MNIIRKKKNLIFLLFFYFIPQYLLSIELSLLCTSRSDFNNNKSFNDLIVKLDSDSKQISIGGLNFIADTFKVSNSNIKWTSKNVSNMYGEKSGSSHGTLGRFSGNLLLTFKKNTAISESKLNLNCTDFKMKDRKF